MAITSTLNFLPEVFRSVTNQRFLGATMDQLVTDVVNIPVNGYIGRTFAPTYKLGDNYVPEYTRDRTNYQLEPTIVVKDSNKNVVLNSNYVDLLQSINNNGGLINNHQRLFKSEYYNYDGHYDYDKFVNYSNYYWLPNGPAAVTVSSASTPLSADYVVTRDLSVNGYTFSGQGGHPNTQLTLARGGTYTFTINQPGFDFWIQTEPGVTGTSPSIATVNTRQVLGVTNNGTDSGVICFNVPQKTAQDFYIALSTPNAASNGVNAAVSFNYSDIQNVLLTDFLRAFPDGLDGIVNQLQNKTLIFINNNVDDSAWTTTGTYLNGTIPAETRSSVWRVNLVANGSGDQLIQLIPVVPVNPLQKVFITSGKTYASTQFWLNNNRRYQSVPEITANADYLFYQDSANPGYVGQIKLVDNQTTPINVESDIVGQASYTSPNGVIFSNGLKVEFDSLVVPSTYATRQYYVEGVGKSICLTPVDQLVVPESFGESINTTADYITINRCSQDQNAWSRTNCWFHRDVIKATAKYNNTDVDYGPNIFGRRAIIEFEPNLQLFNFGRRAKNNVDLITFQSTDAFLDIEGQITYTLVDGGVSVPLTQGMRIIFANDYDTNVLNEIWQVDFEFINGQNFLRLIPTNDDPVLAGENLLVTQGLYTGKTFWFDGSNWHNSQEKTAVNQNPLFDLVDADGYSFSDTTIYPATTFAGTSFFGYAPGTGTTDSVLGFPLTYKNFNNIGDIVFKNYYDTETFTYVDSNNTTTKDCNSGYLVKKTGLTATEKLTNWIPSVEPSQQYQVITKFYDGTTTVTINGITYPYVQIDALPTTSTTVPHIKVYLNNKLLTPSVDYSNPPVAYGPHNLITFNFTPTVGDKINIAIFSDTVSAIGFYEIPENLNYNALNDNFKTITLGQVRTHYNKLIENTSLNSIPVQDQYLKAQGGTLLQQSSPLIYAMTFLTDPTVNFVNGITLARKEYQRFKNKFISLCSTLTDLDYGDPVTGVDTILQNINAVKNSSFSWYYSDMVPQGSDYTTITYTVLNARQTAYEINSIFDSTKLSNRAVLVYLNNVQLVANKDYSYNPLNPEIVINVALKVNDVITIRDYNNTDGNYVPETPVKLGLSRSYPPAIYTDTTYLNPVTVIQGHDGSITPNFGDFRDEYLLELEKRIYNNLKTSYDSMNRLDLHDLLPGRFRTTDYSLNEWNQLLTQNFLQWAGNNNIDYTTNSSFNANNPWTWNYNEFTDSVDGSFLQGSWRAIYNYWFDTDTPHLTPWAMLGFAEQPAWWEKRYGPAPYTNGNTTLWEDLEQGYVWNGSNSAAYIDSRFARPGLSGTLTNSYGFIPVDSAGNLLDPTQSGIVKQQNSTAAGNAYQVGEQGPVETAWRRSSDYPYAIQMALALARPAEYFGTQIDLSRFNVNAVTGQFSDVVNQRINPTLLAVNGDTTTVAGTVQRTAGYLNWIADYIKNLGIDPVAKIETYFNNFNVQLAYRVAGFTDQNLITVTAEQTSPGSTNASIIIPNENYTVYLGQPVPVNSISYSAVIVTRVENGYSVSGYNTSHPFFNIFPSVANNRSQTITVNNLSAKIYETGKTEAISVPYGTTYTTPQQVADFLISYQRYLVSQGFLFNVFDKDLETVRDWILSIKEFLTWAQQGFAEGTLLVLNPVLDTLNVKSVNTVVDEITNIPNGSRLLDTNFIPIKNNNFNVLRVDSPLAPNFNTFQVVTINGSGIAFAKLNLIQYETTLIFDNVDNFKDIIYIPEQGTRQYRLKLQGSKTSAWDGALSPAGYVYSNPIIKSWQTGVDYRQGDIVTYNNSYYTAPTDIVASQNFALSNWTQITLDSIQTGLLPSFSHNARVFQNIYDIDNPPQDENYQLFSAGLIGFRERPFLSNLGLSIPTQTKFYQGYIAEKGTSNAFHALTKATFDNVVGTTEIYEEWAFQVGNYGAVNSNQYTEFVLDQSLFTTNPVAFTATNEFATGNIIVNLAVTGNTTTSNVYNASNILSTSTSLYGNRTGGEYTTDLPSPGYVNLSDIDYQIYDINKVTTMPTVQSNAKIWTAIDPVGSWNVYRITASTVQPTALNYTLDNSAQLIFGGAHGLVDNDLFILQDFDTTYDGLYQVANVINTTSVTITIQNTANIIGVGGYISSTGNVFTLNSMVVESTANISSITPAEDWAANDKVWVNNDTAPGASGWAVYNYTGSTWTRIRQQQPQIDITTIGRTFIYNKSNNVILAAVDFIDPAKGKVLSAIGNDIDYQLATDPAQYNAGNVAIQPNLTIQADYHWGPEQVGKIWWDISAVRYIDYEQDDLMYRMNRWGATFPGSQIRVYEWVQSPVLPSDYESVVGDGVPLYADNSSFCATGYVDNTGAVQVGYYFWVAGKTTINTDANKSNSVYNITAAIINPQSQGIPYATVLRDDTVALYNVNTLLTGKNSILHLGIRNVDAGVIHTEYQLVQEGNPASRIPVSIERKIIDSLAGQDSVGNLVPDPALTVAQAYGIQIRPRQSMFIDKTLALSNYLTFVNSVLLSYPVIESKRITTLNSEEAAPNTLTGEYNQTVNTYAELSYVDTTSLSIGYKILVATDETTSGKWVIYTLTETTPVTWTATKVQSYKTNLYWSLVDYYKSGYNYTVAPNVTVDNLLEFGKLTLHADTYIKVLNNGNNQFVIYYIDSNLTQNLVGIELGTIQISTGTIPALELRQILTAIQNDIFVDDLASNYNKLFFTMVKYALTEQKNLDWVFKTSFISATQYLRKLEQFPAYVADNQQYYADYINEVKPYRTTVRDFVVDYQGTDVYSGDSTDFDLPPYWDAEAGIYRSPNGEQSYDAATLSSGIYTQWSNNYKYQVVDVIIERPGSNYLFAPQITIVGNCTTPATAYATLNGSGGIGAIVITDPGEGYTSTPSININGTGSGALAYPVLRNIFSGGNTGHNLVRSLSTTIKFDRVTYTNSNTFVFWSNITSANIGETIAANTILVNNGLFKLTTDYTIDPAITFPIGSIDIITASTFDNANDRIVAFNGDINLALTQAGIDYPGVVVDGNTFVGNVYDATIESFYGNTLGISPNDITVDGGAYVDRFSSHAPEELVPGHMFDSIDLTVYDTNKLGFRIFGNMTTDQTYYRIAQANVTTITSNLDITDTTMTVVDATLLPKPDPAMNQPGVVFVVGEKITYWRNYAREDKTPFTSNLILPTSTLIAYDGNTYITTGNVYDAGGTFANISGNTEQINNINTLAQIRRAVDGTAPWITNVVVWQPNTLIDPGTALYHLGNVGMVTGNVYGNAYHEIEANVALVKVVDASQQQKIPNTETLTSKLQTTETYTVTDTVSYGLVLTENITANIGEYITQVNELTLSPTVTMRVLGNVSNSSVVPVIIINGTPEVLLEGFDPSSGWDALGDDIHYRMAGSSAPTQRPGQTLPIWTANTASYTSGQALFYNGNVYAALGNAYAMSFANVSTEQTTWTANTVISSKMVYYSGNTYHVTGNVYSSSFNNVVTAGNVHFAWNGNAAVQYCANLTAEFGGSTTLANLSLQLYDQWWNTSSNVLYQWGGATWDLYIPATTGVGFDETPGPVYVNGINANCYILNTYILGKVTTTGTYTLNSNSVIKTGNVWYSPGINEPSNGQGLINSTTVQAEFLKASLGFTPTPGITP